MRIQLEEIICDVFIAEYCFLTNFTKAPIFMLFEKGIMANMHRGVWDEVLNQKLDCRSGLDIFMRELIGSMIHNLGLVAPVPTF